MFVTSELRPRVTHVPRAGFTLSASGVKAYGETLCGQGGTDLANARKEGA